MCKGGLSFNTNDSMIVTGNTNGDIILRNLLHPAGNPPDRPLEIPEGAGLSEVVLCPFNKDSDRCEVTQVRFSFVKRHILASAYANGQIVVWDSSNVFSRPYTAETSLQAKKFTFAGHSGMPCTSICFS